MKTKFLLLTAVACLFTAATTLAQTVPSYIPTNGLLGWWPFNGNANDESGNGNNGTVFDAILSNDRFGISNNSYYFDGNLDYIRVPHSNTLKLSGNFSISCWANSYFQNPFNSFLSKASNDQVSVPGWVFGYYNFQPPYKINFQGYPYFDDQTVSQFGSIINDSTWHNIIVTYDSTLSTLYYYFNGTNVDSFNIDYDFTASTLDVFIGNHFQNNDPSISTPSNGGFIGLIDDIGIWNRALTQQEITALYNSTPCTKPEPVTLGTDRSTKLCPSEAVTIEVVTPSNPGLTYQWTRNGTNLPSATSSSITVSDAAKYKVFVRSGPGIDCQRVSGLIETTAAIPPTITATTPNGNAYCAGDSVLMSATGITPGYSYQWKRFGVPIAGATSAIFYAKQTGNYRCEVSNAGGCINQSNLISIVNGTSCRIMQDQSSDVNVYPNPAKNIFTVSFNDIGNEIPVSIELRNMQGQSIENRKLNGLADVQFNVGKLSPGMYVVRIMLESGDVVEKSVMVE